MELSVQLSASAALSLGNNRGTHWTWVWVGPRGGLDVSEKIKSCCQGGDSNPGSSSLLPSHYESTRYTWVNMTFVGPCIVIYFCSKTNQMHNNSNLFYFGTTLYMFRTVSPSNIRSLRLYTQHHTTLWLLASKQPQNMYDIYLILYVQSWTPDDGWREHPKHVECCSEIK